MRRRRKIETSTGKKITERARKRDDPVNKPGWCGIPGTIQPGSEVEKAALEVAEAQAAYEAAQALAQGKPALSVEAQAAQAAKDRVDGLATAYAAKLNAGQLSNVGIITAETAEGDAGSAGTKRAASGAAGGAGAAKKKKKKRSVKPRKTCPHGKQQVGNGVETAGAEKAGAETAAEPAAEQSTQTMSI